MSDILIVVDGNSLMHRAFYALPPMKNSKGLNTGAMYGFLNMLLRLNEDYSPSMLAVAFDRKAKTYRHEMYPEYKAGRKATPPELIEQLSSIRNLLNDLKIPVLEKDGFEADDFLGILSAQGDKEGLKTYLVTGDKDALQLISDNTHVIMTKKGVTETEIYDKAKLFERYELAPEQIVSLKALMGDSSDNIPGVPGVGEKTALKLLHQYKTVENLYTNIDSLPKNKMREKLENNKASAEMSAKLATIMREADEPINLSDLRFDGFSNQYSADALAKYEFNSFIKRLGLAAKPEIQVESIVLNDTESFKNVISELKNAKLVSVYIDNNCISVADSKHKEYTVYPEQSLISDGIPFDEAFSVLRELLESNAPKVVYGLKNMRHYLNKLGINIPNCIFDVMLAAYVLNPTRRDYGIEKLRGTKSGLASAILSIMEEQQQKIKTDDLDSVLYDIELPLTDVLYAMETEGFKVDKSALEALRKTYRERLEMLAQEIYELSGESFNILSPKQLGTILFDKLELPVQKKTKTGYSTDAEVLEKLMYMHPIIPKIMEYRTISKLCGTYADGLSAIVDKHSSRIHTTFSQTATATGRISSLEPNLQNIPVKTEEGREIRRVFIPSDDEHVIISADYSQIELRVLAHISGDKHMIDAFNNDEDIHTRTASQVFHVPSEMVTGEMRSRAKAVNFGIVYGISDFGLARNLNIPRYEASAYIKNYLAEFEGVSAYMKNIVASAKQDGAVRTLFGRVRYIDELSSSNHNTRSFGERVAMNTPIQGTAADIIKCAMNKVYEEFNKNNLRSKLILQVHDELVVDAYKDEIETVKSILKQCMENVISMDVPLKVDINTGTNWAEAK